MSDSKKTKPSTFPTYELIFANPEDAKKVLDTTKAFISRYGVATVADVKEFADCNYKYTDTKYGWISSDRMAVRMLDYYNPDKGYLLYTPRPVLIDYDESDAPKFKAALPKAAKDAKIQKAYNTLTKAYCNSGITIIELNLAVEEAVGYLGEVLE